MQLVMCSIRDIVVGAFNRPYFLVSRGQAIRSFQDEVMRSSEDNPMYKHPADYELYELGKFDDQSGGFEVYAQPELIARGSDVQ